MFNELSYSRHIPPWYVRSDRLSTRCRAFSTNLKPTGAQAIKSGLSASSCHVSAKATTFSIESMIHCWMLADLLPTDLALNRPTRTESRWRWRRTTCRTGTRSSWHRHSWNSWSLFTSTVRWPLMTGISQGLSECISDDVALRAASRRRRQWAPARQSRRGSCRLNCETFRWMSWLSNDVREFPRANSWSRV